MKTPRRCREVLEWSVPGLILVLLPKCPACLAAYLAVGTGLGLSLPVAGAVRWTLLIACSAALVYLVIRQVRRITRPRISQNHC
jgi:hypothetical protein